MISPENNLEVTEMKRDMTAMRKTNPVAFMTAMCEVAAEHLHETSANQMHLSMDVGILVKRILFMLKDMQ